VDGAAFTLKLASAVLPLQEPFADTVYLIVTVSSDPIFPVTYLPELILPLPETTLGVPVPAKVTLVPSHIVDVEVVLVAVDGAAFTVNFASAVVAGQVPLAATVYLIVTVSSDPIFPVTYLPELILPLPAIILGVPVPDKVTFVPSHIVDVEVVFVAVDGTGSTVFSTAAVYTQEPPHRCAPLLYQVVCVIVGGSYVFNFAPMSENEALELVVDFCQL
jgi:hypothetical protein